jgi:putative drug exporter of the RND superfamily
VVVFGSFALEDDRVIRMFGLGLAVAVLLDATLIRMLLVPATMELLGARNWWLPRWLDRLVPRLSADGTGTGAGRHDDGTPLDEPETDEPMPGAPYPLGL